MPAHFKQPDEPGRASLRSPSAPARRTRGGDESDHAPASNSHASASAPGQAVGYRAVVGTSGTGTGAHRRRDPQVDPYDIKDSRNPRRRRAKVFSTVLFAIGIALLLVAAGLWGYNQWQYHQQDVVNEKLAAYATVDDSGSNAPQVDWSALKALNPEAVAWVQIPGTVVNFPVFQSSDNEKYLHTDANGDRSLGGQVFLDCENAAPGMQDQQTMVYGHHLRNGAMFKAVADMENQAALDSVDTVWYVTPDATYELRPLFVYKTDGDDTDARTFDFESADAFHEYLQGLLARSSSRASDAQAAIEGSDRVLSLCTCSYTGNETGRVILVCAPKDSSQG